MIGERIRLAMSRAGLDQATLASRAGMSVTALSLLMNNHTQEPRLNVVIRIAEATGSDLGWLATGKGKPSSRSQVGPLEVTEALAKCLRDHGPNETYARLAGGKAEYAVPSEHA